MPHIAQYEICMNRNAMDFIESDIRLFRLGANPKGAKEMLMSHRHSPLLERMCRALCQARGYPTDARFQGKPMWESYRREARAALDASSIEELLEAVRFVMKAQGMPADLRKELSEALARVEGEGLRGNEKSR
jgi:hypothetical protein